MIAFEISINGTKRCLAGIREHGVVTTVLTRVWRTAASSQEELDLTVGGLISESGQEAENLRWLDEPLNPGDTITIRILEVSSGDEPAQREQEDTQRQERREREYYKRMKSKYEQ
jgi:hypothetical protein